MHVLRLDRNHDIGRVGTINRDHNRVVRFTSMHSSIGHCAPVALLSIDANANAVADQQAPRGLVPEDKLALTIDRTGTQVADDWANLRNIHAYAPSRPSPRPSGATMPSPGQSRSPGIISSGFLPVRSK